MEKAPIPRLREGGTRLLDALYPRQALNHDPDLRNATGVRDAVRAGAERMEEVDVIVPVPLHWLRLFQHYYNQAAELDRPLERQ